MNVEVMRNECVRLFMVKEEKGGEDEGRKGGRRVMVPGGWGVLENKRLKGGREK